MGIKGARWNYRDERFKRLHKECVERFAELANERKKQYLEEQKRKEEQREKENKEGLALVMLLQSLGNEDSMNEACDVIKQMGLVKDYE